MTFTIILIAGGAIVVVLLIVGIVVSINSESSLVELNGSIEELKGQHLVREYEETWLAQT